MTAMFRRVGLAVALAVVACSSRSDVKHDPGGSSEADSASRPTFTLFALAELRGQIGPCGCTSDPLGDLARTAQLVRDARAAGPVLVVDAGSLLYSKSPIPPHLAAQEELKADLLAEVYGDELKVGALGLGPADLVQGPGKLRAPRHAVNVSGDAGIATAAPAVIELGGTKVGVFGVIANDAIPGLALRDPAASGKQAVAQLRRQGAQIVVALVQAASKKDAAKLVREIGSIDVAVAGLGLAAPEPEKIETVAQQVGDGWLVVPANRGQVMSRLDVSVRPGGGPLADAIGPASAQIQRSTIEAQLAALDADLAKYASDKSADPGFIKQKQAERGQLIARRDQLRRSPLVIPARGSFFTFEQLRINKTRACAPEVQTAVTAFYRAAGEANVAAAAGIAVPPPAKGQAGYVGGAACEDCHGEAVEFWKRTRHAGAWKTLVDRGQQFDFDCIGCHVTGWDQKGGANLAFNEPLRDVQCETCHGPASIHVAKGGEEKPSTMVRNPPADLCATQCHTIEHSDTFEYTAYLRDVIGPGHGEALRKRLGDGPTGKGLRGAALAKAGRLGPGCIR